MRSAFLVVGISQFRLVFDVLPRRLLYSIQGTVLFLLSLTPPPLGLASSTSIGFYDCVGDADVVFWCRLRYLVGEAALLVDVVR